MIQGAELTLKQKSINQKENTFQSGYFVYYESEKVLYFRDAAEKNHPIEYVHLLTSEADVQNGVKNLPKPYLLGPDGGIKEFGANVLYTFINGDESNIVVLGALQNFGLTNIDKRITFDTRDFDNLNEKNTSRDNKNRYFSVSEDGQGNLNIILEGKEQNGNISVKLHGNESQSNGNIKLEMNGKFILNLTDDEQKVYTQVFFDNTTGDEKVIVLDKHKNKVVLNKQGTIIETATIRIGKDETLKKLLVDLFGALQKMTHTTPAGPTVAPPINWSEFDAIKQRIEKFMDVQ